MERKYEFTGLEKEVHGVIVRQIKAVRSFGDVKKGDIGGWIGMEFNLSHAGNAWVKDNAAVIDDSIVCDNAVISGNALVMDGSVISGNAVVCDNAMIFESKICGNATVRGFAHTDSGVEITYNAIVCDNTHVEPHAYVYGNAMVCGYGCVPACTGVGDSIIINKVDYNDFCEKTGNKIVDKLWMEAERIENLRSIVRYWLFSELTPYGLEKKDFSKPSEFKEAVENFILNDESLNLAMVAYYCAVEPDCECDYVDRDTYNFDSVDLPARLFYTPTGWKGRRTSNPVISIEDALREVKRNGHLLRWIEEQTPEICMAAVQQNGEALQWVKEQTLELCAAAMMNSLGAERFAKWKPVYEEPEADENGFVSFNEEIEAELESVRARRLVKVCA